MNTSMLRTLTKTKRSLLSRAKELMLACLLGTVAYGQTPAISSSQSSYKGGETISIDFSGAPGNQKDWIGVYPEGVEPGPTPSTLWFYLDGTQDGLAAVTEGTITFEGGLTTGGVWKAYLLENDGYTILAETTFTVPGVTADKAVYRPGEPISVTFSHGPGNDKDWVGIYPEGVEPGPTPSTLWYYVDGTQDGLAGATEGTIVFSTGLSTAGTWDIHFLENDGYTILASTQIEVGEPGGDPVVMPEHTMYVAGTPITVAFTNGPANPKDWIGVFPEGVTPADGTATVRSYTDGGTGTTGTANGTVTFSSGIADAGTYLAYLLENDGNTFVATNKLIIAAPEAPILRLDKRVFETGEAISALFTNTPGNPKDWIGIYPEGALPGSVNATSWLYVDGTQDGIEAVLEGSITFPTGMNLEGNWVAYLLENDGYNILGQESFTVLQGEVEPPTNNIVLPAPIYFEDFNATAEGSIPEGWTTQSFTEVFDENPDLGNLNSLSYANWVVVDSARFTNTFLSYGAGTPTEDYRRVLTFNPQNVVNGQVVSNLATGNFLFTTSGYRDGRSQVNYIFTPDFDLTGKTNVHLSYHSLYEQNQDSIGAVEYSIDGGTNWLPVIYMINAGDIITNETGIDAVATLTTEAGDIAYYDNLETGETFGGTYGTFIGAPITADLADYISGRVDDNATESKRVELFPLPQADNQARVRFRFAYAGTDSWYFGVDNFGLYSIGESSGTGATITSVTVQGGQATLNWTGGTGPFQVQQKGSLTDAQWQNVGSPTTGNTFTTPATGAAGFFRIAGE